MFVRKAKNQGIPDTEAERVHSLDALFKGTSLFPFRFVGMGLFLVWLMAINIDPIIFSAPQSFDARNVYTDTHRLFDVLALILLAVFSDRIGLLSKHRTLQRWALLLALAGPTFAYLLLNYTEPNPNVLRLCGALSGSASAVFFLSWAEIYSRLGDTRTLVFGSLACIFASLVSLILLNMVSPANAIFAILLPLPVYICLRGSALLLPSEKPSEKSSTESVPKIRTRNVFPISPVLIMMVAGFASGFSAPLLAPGGEYRMAATGITGVMAIACALLFRERFKVLHLAYLAFPLMALSFILLLGIENGTATASLVFIKLGYLLFTFSILYMLAHFANNSGISPLWIFGLARASSEGAIGVGILLSRLLLVWSMPDGIPLVIISIVAFAAVVFVAILWHSSLKKADGWGIRAVEVLSGTVVKTDRERFIDACEQFSSECGLTARESEVLIYLAEGQTRTDIEKRVFLSSNTVKTHMRHIYSKLDLHSQEELIEKVKQRQAFNESI